ncbi:MAG: GAF domain-containing protein, partial [Gemmatimonadaceae bacterium]
MTQSSATSGELRLRTPAEGVDFGLRELLAVREIVHAFLTADRPEEVFQFALDRVSPVVGATFACVYLVDGASELMRLAAAHNWPERYTQFLGEMRVRLGFGPSGEAASERRAIEVPDIFADPSLEDWQEVANELGFRSLAALPLQTGDGILGTVTFYFASAGGLSVETRSLLRMVADQMAATAQKARLIDNLRRANSALTDTNAELERQYAALLEARRLQDEFLANLSTALRTPLAELVGYISRIQTGAAGPLTEAESAALLEVKESGEGLLSRIADLLEISELKRDGVEPAVSVFDPREPMREALALTGGRRDGVALQS